MMRTSKMLSITALCGLALTACEGNVPPPEVPTPPPPTAAPVAADPIGTAKPELPAPKAFEPPAPVVYKAANGMNVWLLERHTLPMVSVTLALPYGSASDPQGKEGLAHITADMLDEGAGSRDAVALSTAVNDLGAALHTGAGMDGSTVSLVVLKKNFKPAFDIFSDVVARPRFDAKEWKRVSSLWQNDLQKRAQDPGSVSRVAMAAALYGAGTPYGHPSNGLLSSATKVDLKAVKDFYAKHYRPDQATLVVAGDVTRAELDAVLGPALDGWKASGKAAPPSPVGKPVASPPRLVLVDRPDAPQSVLAVVRSGVAAADPKAPLLDLINTALGGSFTSRLNQDLREEHGWSYGAGSRFAETRGTGAFIAYASVVTDATGQAAKAMLADLDKMATAGLTPDELDKVRAQDRADLVQTYETVGSISRRLGSLAVLGLPPAFDANASRSRQQASKSELDALAAAVSPNGATIVVVGPAAAVTPQLDAAGLGKPELYDTEGNPLKAGAPEKPAKAAPKKKK
ncbi:peptidase, M16 family protein [Minicystis rosea]|nr:peptidase, M16 family protein [Minicystis rosea]